ncbi:MAG: dihydropteroate synthase [Clostridiales bacterium]|nr:dihydropteroate synthase [Clostridiales bacterium]
MKIGNRIFDTENKGYIMGILNVAPDSFSDGGRYNSLDKALKHCEEMIEEGADIIDIGGESTRPNYQKISDGEEIERVCPVIEGIKARFDIPLSVDTYKSAVAEAALSAGADLLNDIWGLKYDGKMAGVIRKFDVPCCLMHNREKAVYDNFVEDVIFDLRESLDIAERAGIEKDKIILDPGVGFGKDYKQNLTVIRELDRLKAFGLPLLLGTSRKSVIGLTLDLPSDKRVEGTIATTVIGALKGAALFRVHDVAANRRALIMTEAIIKNGLN